MAWGWVGETRACSGLGLGLGFWCLVWSHGICFRLRLGSGMGMGVCLGSACLVSLVLASVADPDPPDPHVFGPPGSGSFYYHAKIVRKTLILTIL